MQLIEKSLKKWCLLLFLIVILPSDFVPFPVFLAIAHYILLFFNIFIGRFQLDSLLFILPLAGFYLVFYKKNKIQILGYLLTYIFIVSHFLVNKKSSFIVITYLTTIAYFIVSSIEIYRIIKLKNNN